MYGWQARPCMNLHGMYRWFDVVSQVLVLPYRPPFCWFLELFVVIFVVGFWGRVLARFFLGVTYEDFVPLWLVTLPQESPWIGLDLVVFWVAQVLALERRFLRFLLTVSDSGWFLWGRGFPGGNPAIPEVSLQSVECFGRSGNGKLRVDLRVGFLEGRSNHLWGAV
jgi:hypothetical protein